MEDIVECFEFEPAACLLDDQAEAPRGEELANILDEAIEPRRPNSAPQAFRKESGPPPTTSSATPAFCKIGSAASIKADKFICLAIQW